MFTRKNYLIKKRFQLKYTLSIAGLLLIVMAVSSLGTYFGMWGSIIENFSEFKTSENLEVAKRITGLEEKRYNKGDYRLERIFREAQLLSIQQKEALKNALRAVNRSMLPKIILLIIVIFIAGIFISHKIAGPMYRIERSAESIRDGDLRVGFKLRKSDEMKDTAHLLDDMIHSLRADFIRIKENESALEKELDKIKNSITREDSDKLKNIIKNTHALLDKYKV